MADETIGQWASALELGKPVRMGELERQILARPVPDSSSAEPRFGLVRMAFVAVVAVVFFLLPPGAVALTFAAAAMDDHDLAGSLLIGASSAAMIGAFLPLSVIIIWWAAYDRRREGVILFAAVAMPVIAVASTLALWVSGVETTAIVSVSSVAGSALAIALAAIVAFASRPATAAVAERADDDTTRRLAQRAIALRVLNSRGIIDDDTMLRALDMPLGSWEELDVERGTVT